ncbi:NHL repeat-containing protein [Arenibacter echinorum]|uniref:Uncharacterized protein n=1 Tax=Arenibacter echinorum TaxID=440515 RepID=A0A327R9W7_9FLAO|nr:hypothetical protein [Arenibacter echinorum]RAJ12283.1 hypothetical protein LV92_01516 [Arenibacter echinorum]
MFKKTTLVVLSIASTLGLSSTLLAQNNQHSQDHTHHAHEHNDVAHHHPHDPMDSDDIPKQAKLLTGQGEFIFSWDQELTAAFPKDAHEFEPGMHGGFNEDPETGIVYTGIPGYGLCAISPDLTKWSTLGTDQRLKDNIHGIVFFVHKGKKYLAVAQEGKRVLVLTLDGTIVSEVLKPTGNEFKFAEANEFFGSKDSNFGVTDVTYLNGTLYVAHGYSAGDFVMTIKEKNGVWAWGKLAWGGKGDNPGQFQTAHGIYAHENHILVANRAAGQVVKFTKKGKFIETFNDIPEGSLVCNVSYKSEHYFLNALSAIGEQKSAPIYVHTGEKLLSTIVAGDLDIPVLTNIHQVWPHIVTENGSKQLYLLVHGWNKGKFAVLKMEK